MAAHPDERESERDERGKKGDGFSRVTEAARRENPHRPAGQPRHSAHGLHFHHPMKYTNAIIIANMVAGMHNSSLLAAQPAPTQFSFVCGGRIKQHIICSNFIFSLLGCSVIIIITVIITHLALVVVCLCVFWVFFFFWLHGCP